MRTRLALIAWRLDSRAIGLVTMNCAYSAEQIIPQEAESQLQTITEARTKIFFDHRDFVGNKETSLL